MSKLQYTVAKRVCSCCGEAKNPCEFYTQSVTGLPTNQCKDCIKIKKRVERAKSKHGKFVSKEKCRGMEPVCYSLIDWRDAMIHFGGKCCYCGCSEGRAKADKFDREHLVPVSRGGKTVRNNIVPSCRRCNRGRGNRPLVEWFREQSFWTADRERRIREWINQ